MSNKFVRLIGKGLDAGLSAIFIDPWLRRRIGKSSCENERDCQTVGVELGAAVDKLELTAAKVLKTKIAPPGV